MLKRILFVQERSFVKEEGVIFPLGISYLKAVLPEGVECRVVDLNLHDDYRILKMVGEDFAPDCICLSIRNIKLATPGASSRHISTLDQLHRTIGAIDAHFPAVPLFVGGTAFSLYAEPLMQRFRKIDVGFFGEGEDSFPLAIERFPDLDSIKGLYLRNGDEEGTIRFTGYPETMVNFSSLPFPDREGFDIERYEKVPYSIGVQTKRGCAFKCIHCSDLYLLGNNIRMREPEDVVSELLSLKSRFGIQNFMFVDQCFNNPLSHAIAICEEMLRKGVNMRWVAWFTERNITPEFLNLLKRAGCEYLSFSPDSVNDTILKGLSKNITREDIERALEMAYKAGMPVSMNFFLPNPGENLGTVMELFSFILKKRVRMGKLFKIHGLFIVPIRIYPHTELQKKAIAEGIIDEKDDLLETRFYSPSPIYQIVSVIMGGVNMVFRLRNFLQGIR